MLANQRRGVGRRDRLGDRLRHELRGLASPDHAGMVEASLTVGAALGELDELDREVLRLCAWEGLAPQEVAIVLSISPATARTRLHRARHRLRGKLDKAGIVAAGERRRPDGHVDHDEHLLVPQPEDER